MASYESGHHMTFGSVPEDGNPSEALQGWAERRQRLDGTSRVMEDALELHREIDGRYDARWREQLARSAVEAALSATKPGESLEGTATRAVYIALGLEPLTEAQEGEQ